MGLRNRKVLVTEVRTWYRYASWRYLERSTLIPSTEGIVRKPIVNVAMMIPALVHPLPDHIRTRSDSTVAAMFWTRSLKTTEKREGGRKRTRIRTFCVRDYVIIGRIRSLRDYLKLTLFFTRRKFVRTRLVSKQVCSKNISVFKTELTKSGQGLRD